MAEILIISAHPDDETLGMGGTLLKRRDGGDRLFWMILTSAKAPKWDEGIIRKKEMEIAAVSQVYRFQAVFRLGFPAAGLTENHRCELMDAVAKGLEEVSPSEIFLMFGRDVHTDHRLGFECALAVMKPFRFPSIRRIWCYETLSSTELAPPLPGNSFQPNAYCDITEYLEEKIRVMNLYQTEIQRFPMPRCAESIRALARYRGGAIGIPYAEGFWVLREVI